MSISWAHETIRDLLEFPYMHLNVTFIIITALDEKDVEKAELVNGQCILLAGDIGGYISGLLQRWIIPSWENALFWVPVYSEWFHVSIGWFMMNEWNIEWMKDASFIINMPILTIIITISLSYLDAGLSIVSFTIEVLTLYEMFLIKIGTTETFVNKQLKYRA